MPFRFKVDTQADLIRNFVDTLCVELPEVAQELLNIPIKSVEHWLMKTPTTPANVDSLTGNEIAALPCGCLIGATIIASARLYPDAVDAVNGEKNFVPSTAVTLATDLLKTLDGEFDNIDYSITNRVGMAVSDEVHGISGVIGGHERRERALEKYIKDRIRKNLSNWEN